MAWWVWVLLFAWLVLGTGLAVFLGRQYELLSAAS
jgi:hypothetical protein